MKTAIMQPYLFPYMGYFQLIHAVDQFVIYDDVNYIKNGWINRNQYLVNGQKKIFTLSLNKASSFKLIKDTYILDDENHRLRKKILKTLAMAYSKAPFYKMIFDLIEEIILYPNNNIAAYNENSIRKICSYLNIKTSLLISSALNMETLFVAQERVIEICLSLGTTLYINAIGGKSLYNQADFNKKGLELRFLRSNSDRIHYHQFNDKFVPGLSIIDVLMFNPVEGIQVFLQEYSLEK
jgi:hypothetical protein